MYLTDKTKAILEKNLGMPISYISAMDFDEEKQFVETKTKHSIKVFKQLSKLQGDNLLINRGRICTMENINKKIDELWLKGDNTNG